MEAEGSPNGILMGLNGALNGFIADKFSPGIRIPYSFHGPPDQSHLCPSPIAPDGRLRTHGAEPA